MITTVTKNKFLKALQATERILSKGIHLPILSHILLKTDKGQLKIVSTNLEIGITFWVGAKNKEEGEIAVPARTITDFIQNISDEKILITAKKNNLILNSDNYKTQILGSETKEFPIIPEIKNNPVIKIPSIILFNALTSVIDAASPLETRPELTGVYIEVEKTSINFAATDGFRLAEKIITSKDSPKKNEPVSFIIPKTTAVEVSRIISDIDEDIYISITDNQVLIKGSDFEVVSRLIEGRYPDYKKIIPEKFISKALFNKNDLQKQVRLSSIFSSGIFDVTIQVQADKTIISAKNNEKGEIFSSLSSLLKNEPFSFSINYNYLLDGLKIINSPKVVIEYTGEGAPVVIKPEDSKDTTYLIMPLRQ